MNHKEIINKVHTFESSQNKKLLNINGIDMWPLVKFQISLNCFDKIDSDKVPDGKLFNRILKKFKLFKNKNFFSLILQAVGIKNNEYKLKKREILFLSDESSKRIPFNNKWIDIFIDTYIHKNSLKEGDFFIFRSNQIAQSKKLPYSREMDINPIVIRSFIYAGFDYLFQKSSKVLLSEYKMIEKFCNDELEIDAMPKFKNIIFEACFLGRLSKNFGELLDKVQPKKVVLTHYNGYISSAMTHASKTRSIPVSDIQHGVQGKLHPAYNFRNYPREGYTTVPDNFLVWNHADATNIKLWGSDRCSSNVFGNPNRYLFNSFDEITHYYSNRFDEAFYYQLQKKLILITLCWSYYIPDLILNFIKNAQNNLFFLVRFHPMTSNDEKKVVVERLESLKKNNYEYINSTELPLHLILPKVSMHIGIVSTVLEEGLEYGVPTIATHSRAKAYWGDSHKNKISFVNSYSDLKKSAYQYLKD